MTKQYFGRRDNVKAIYAVAFNSEEEMMKFTKLMEIKFNMKYSVNVPELFDEDKGYYYAVGYTMYDTADKKDFEEIYSEIKSLMSSWKRARKLVA